MSNFSGLLKKLVFGLIILFSIFLSYQYQKPIMTTGEAVIKAESVLQNPPKDLAKLFSEFKQFKFSDVKSEDIHAVLKQKRGFFNELTNQREWEITIKYKNQSPTVVLNAYNGKFISWYGPVS